MLLRYLLTFTLCFLTGILIIGAGESSEKVETVKYQDLDILFYNVENLFDTIDDPEKNDDDYLPGAEKHWNSERYFAKLDSLAMAIQGVLGLRRAIVGLAEVENRQVLEDLITHPVLAFRKFKIIHQDSPDDRGIDVALLIPGGIRFDSSYFIPIQLPGKKQAKTRDILMARFYLQEKAIWISVSHFPSRRGGEANSRKKRVFVASQLRKHLDLLEEQDTGIGFILMGDFNDEPMDSSLYRVLGAGPDSSESSLVNLMWPFQERGYGSYSYHNTWSMLDQIIVSRNLLGESKVFVLPNSPRIYVADFLKEKEGKFVGSPFRTYAGNNYLGGFSDHFPVLATLRY